LKIYWDVWIDTLKALGEFGRGTKHPVEALKNNHDSIDDRNHEYSGSRKLLLNTYFSSMPLHAWLIRPGTKNIYQGLQRTQWLSTEELQELQVWRLQRLLWHSYAHVPYYKRLFVDNGLHPRDFKSLSDLMKLPFLNKSDVTENLYMDLFSETHIKKDMHKIATSGSTGQPFVTYADRQQLEIRFASTMRSYEWTGWRIGDKQVRLWHQKLGMRPTQVIKEQLDAKLMRRTFIPAFELSSQGLEQFAAKLNKVRPVLIDGYAESLNFLALYLNQGGTLNFAPQAILSSAQMLTAGTRNQIESALGAKVFDKYGAREFSGIAYQCNKSSDHHIVDESYVVEIVKEGRIAKPGELGEVVITDLNNFSVPLIRYRIGDLAVASDNTQDCDCGRGLSRMGDIQGRTQALVHCANGKWLPGTFFAHFFKEYDYLVTFFQVQQHQKGAFILRIVKSPQWTDGSWAELTTNLRHFVGDTEITMEYVNEIPLMATGKRTPVISSVKVDFQDL